MSEEINDNQIDIFNHKFGVEIEMTGISGDKAARVLKNHFKDRKSPFYLAKDAMQRKWIIKSDSSIKKEGKHGGQVEFITPILEYKDIKTLKEIIIKLRQAGAIVNETCGLHIHLDGRVHTSNSIKRLMVEVSIHQDMLYEALKVHRHRTSYCKKIHIKDVQRIIEPSLNDLKDISKAIGSRNQIINLRNISEDKHKQKNTIEFRAFNSTMNEDEVEAYIKLCLALSTRAINGPDYKNPHLEHIEIEHELYSPNRLERLWSLLNTFRISIQKPGDNKIIKVNEPKQNNSQKTIDEESGNITRGHFYSKAHLWFASMELDPISVEQLTKNIAMHSRGRSQKDMDYINI